MTIRSFVKRYFGKSAPIEPAKRSFSFEDQIRYENEGGQAGLAGKTRDDCPYDRDKQSGPWNHWVYGNDIARHEVEVIKKGGIEWYSTSNFDGPPILVKSVADSIRDGSWKPRFASVHMHTILYKSSD